MDGRTATQVSGILAFDKPAGMTSHDVVSRVRQALRQRRVGHAGTLDPMATGLLAVLVGSATRLARFVEAGAKEYEARIVFGAETDTGDAEGAVIATAPVPYELADPVYAARAVAALVGEHDQMPPAYSAIKIGGRKAYEMARKGETPRLTARPITIYEALLTGVQTGAAVSWDTTLTVSRGTYVRSIARDVGRACGTVAHLGALRRTRIGALRVDGALTLDTLLELSPEQVAAHFVDPVRAVGLPAGVVGSAEAIQVSHGSAIGARAG